MAIRRKLIERKARDLLQALGIQHPPVDVDEVARHLGVTVVVDPDASEDVSGFILLDDGQPIVGVNGQHPKTRRRFTIAHELGHFVLHPQENGVAHVDKSLLIKFRNSKSSTGQYAEEVEANLFAAELLMPRHLLEKEMVGSETFDVDDRDKTITRIATKYEVSEQALLIRLSNLRFI